MQFNSLLDKHLKKMNFKQSMADPCLYTKSTPDGTIILSTHVDDMLLTAPNLKYQKWFEREMEKRFELVKQYENISYLGMNIVRKPNGDIHVSQTGFIKDIIKKFHYSIPLAKYPRTPTSVNLLRTNSSSPPCDQKKFLSMIMSLMYLARFTRPDILFPVTFLASKCAAPTQDDLMKLNRIFRFLQGTSCFQIAHPYQACRVCRCKSLPS
jgi:hypothetical protein